MADCEYENHENRLMSSLQQMMNSEQFADVILCCADGYKLRAHKVVLSYCSSYLEVRSLEYIFLFFTINNKVEHILAIPKKLYEMTISRNVTRHANPNKGLVSITFLNKIMFYVGAYVIHLLE